MPLTVIGGFLGSGKTSLLNHILSQAEGERIAVLINDFGALNIDAKLIVAVEGETVSLANGCICCSIRDDLLSEVLRLLAREPRPERIVIETSGVSQPIAVAETFQAPAVQGLVALEGLIGVLDAALVLDPEAGYSDLAFDQIRTADLVVINKCDLAETEARAALVEQVRRILPRARLWQTSFGRVPLELIFAGRAAEPAAGVGTLSHAHPDFASCVHRDARAWSFSALQSAIEALPSAIYRAKGLVRLNLPGGEMGELQMTGRRCWLRLRPPAPDVEPALLLIGTPGVTDEAALAALFDDAFAAQDRQGDEGHLVTDLRSFSVIFD